MLLRREAQRRHSAGLEDLGRLLRATVDHLTTSRPLIHATASSGTTVEPCKKHAKSNEERHVCPGREVHASPIQQQATSCAESFMNLNLRLLPALVTWAKHVASDVWISLAVFRSKAGS